MPVSDQVLSVRDAPPIFKTVEQRTVAFFHDHLDLVPTSITRNIHPADQFCLREITAIVGVGSSSGLYIAFSYDQALAWKMTERYTAELVIAPDETELYMHETALDVVNVIIGNCTADLAGRGETISLSPPVLALGARTMQGRSRTAVGVLSLNFPEGGLDIAFVGPKQLFDEQLNYVGDV